MKLNKKFKQISVNTIQGYSDLKGKVVDKVAFNNRGNHDEHMFIITFTDNTFICVGTEYADLDGGDDTPKLENNWIMDPQCIDHGNFECHCFVKEDGTVQFSRWIEILRDLGIWELSDKETLEIIERDRKKKEDREYQQYLRLKEKFEKK